MHNIYLEIFKENKRKWKTKKTIKVGKTHELANPHKRPVGMVCTNEPAAHARQSHQDDNTGASLCACASYRVGSPACACALHRLFRKSTTRGPPHTWYLVIDWRISCPVHPSRMPNRAYMVATWRTCTPHMGGWSATWSISDHRSPMWSNDPCSPRKPI